jgi:hypothetical protein
MTGQTILNLMEVLNQELQLQTGEADVTRGLLALNAAQDQFESIAAQVPNILGSSSGTVTTTANVESTAFPAGLLRLDGLDYLDTTVTPNLPVWPVARVSGIGMHAYVDTNRWVLSATTGGRPEGYWTNGTNIYWAPLPDATYTVRYYGFSAAADLTAAGTFTYPDMVALPLASAAVRLLKVGLDDSADSIAAIITEVLTPVLRALGAFNRDGAVPLSYTRLHLT